MIREILLGPNTFRGSIILKIMYNTLSLKMKKKKTPHILYT
jgi:hypothetical protein